MRIKTKQGFKIHIGRIHQGNVLDLTPQKKRIVAQKLAYSHPKKVREEPPSEDNSENQLVCTKYGDLCGSL